MIIVRREIPYKTCRMHLKESLVTFLFSSLISFYELFHIIYSSIYNINVICLFSTSTPKPCQPSVVLNPAYFAFTISEIVTFIIRNWGVRYSFVCLRAISQGYFVVFSFYVKENKKQNWMNAVQQNSEFFLAVSPTWETLCSFGAPDPALPQSPLITFYRQHIWP